VRRRLVRSTLGVVAVAILALGLPLVFVSLKLIRDGARTELLREAQTVQGYVEDRVQTHRPVDDRLTDLVPSSDRVTVSLPGKAPIIVGAREPSDALAQTIQLGPGGTVRVERSAGPVHNQQVRVGLLIGVVALTAAAVAAGVALLSARRLSVPLLDVASRAARLGAGDFRSAPRRHGIPELDRVSDVLDRSAAQIADLVGRERDLASNVSHQLRSRLTALSMRLEELSEHDDPYVRDEATQALEQAERLNGVIAELLAHARDRRAAEADRIDLGAEIATIVGEYAPTVRRAGREVRIDCEPGLRAMATSGRLQQAVGALVDNAFEHGSGAVRVTAYSTGRNAVIEVTDQGAGVPTELVARLFDRGVSGGNGTGLGLALARALVEADGGRLELRRSSPPVFAVFLPRVEPI
jgi:signal transduction histidine kinase